MKYEYGVEYETNGRKPDLPDDVKLYINFMGDGMYMPSGEITMWGGVKSFRIVDERYKPKEKDMNDNWYERGELPPVGEVAEAMTGNGTWIECQVLHHRVNNSGMNVAACMNTLTHGLFWSADFKPLRTEHDALIEKAEMDIHQKYIDVVSRHHIQTLIDAGWRPVKQQSEDEFVDQSGLDDDSGRIIYRAGCRFIEQG